MSPIHPTTKRTRTAAALRRGGWIDQLSASAARLVERRSDVVRWMGLLGNLLFITGSVCFLSPATEKAGVWQFLAGSVLLMLRALATAFHEVRQEQRESGGRERT